MYHTKFIINDRKHRLKLLAGFVDSECCKIEDDHLYSKLYLKITDLSIATDLQFLMMSLGITASFVETPDENAGR